MGTMALKDDAKVRSESVLILTATLSSVVVIRNDDPMTYTKM